MGAWGTGVLDSDGVLDALEGLTQGEDSAEICAAFDDALDTDYVDAEQAETVLAAAELVAALCGRPSERLPEAAASWVRDAKALVDNDCRLRAVRAVARVARRSELRELWEEGDLLPEWERSVEGLRRRLEGAPAE